jgi:hypothetical protein
MSVIELFVIVCYYFYINLFVLCYKIHLYVLFENTLLRFILIFYGFIALFLFEISVPFLNNNCMNRNS